MRRGNSCPIPFENLQFILPVLKIWYVILKAKGAFKDDFYVTFLLYFSKLFLSLSVSSSVLLYTAVLFVPMRRINYQVNGIFMKWNLKNLCLTGISCYFSFQSTGNFSQFPGSSLHFLLLFIVLRAHQCGKQKRDVSAVSFNLWPFTL
jgi:hypothetical protein